MRRNRTREVIGETITLFEKHNMWTTGDFHRDGRYCLVGGINHVQHQAPMARGVWRTNMVVYALGFTSTRAAIHWNDRQRGVKMILQRLRAAYVELDPWVALHNALDESRVAHAQRDLGRNVPSTIPEAWVEEQQVKEEVTVR